MEMDSLHSMGSSLFACIQKYVSFDVSHLPIPSMQNIVSFVYKISYIKHESKIFESGGDGGIEGIETA
jgi:hypothetical protein